jgi:hypothetical protein
MSAISILVAICLATNGVVHATAGTNIEWFGYEDSNGYGYYLGYSSGGSGYVGNIHTFLAPSKCLDIPGGQFFTTGQAGNFNAPGGNPTGAVLQLYDCMPPIGEHGNDLNQLWHQVDNGDGSWTYYVDDGPDIAGNTYYYCLDSVNQPSATVEPCVSTGTLSQKWTIGPQGQVQSVGDPGACLQTDSFNGANGDTISLGFCQYG